MPCESMASVASRFEVLGRVYRLVSLEGGLPSAESIRVCYGSDGARELGVEDTVLQPNVMVRGLALPEASAIWVDMLEPYVVAHELLHLAARRLRRLLEGYPAYRRLGEEYIVRFVSVITAMMASKDVDATLNPLRLASITLNGLEAAASEVLEPLGISCVYEFFIHAGVVPSSINVLEQEILSQALNRIVREPCALEAEIASDREKSNMAAVATLWELAYMAETSMDWAAHYAERIVLAAARLHLNP